MFKINDTNQLLVSNDQVVQPEEEKMDRNPGRLEVCFRILEGERNQEVITRLLNVSRETGRPVNELIVDAFSQYLGM